MLFSRLLLLAFLVTSCIHKPLTGFTSRPSPAYMSYPLARPVKVIRDSRGHVVTPKKAPQ